MTRLGAAKRTSSLLLLGFVLLACWSCNTAPRADEQVRPIVEIRGAAQPASIAAEDLALTAVGGTRWQRVDAQWRPLTTPPVELVTSTVDEGDAGRRVEGIDDSIDFLAFRADGSLQLRRTESVGDDARTTFDPPLLLAPRTLSTDGDFESNASMRVASLTKQRERDKGSANRTVRVVRGERVRTPIGEWDATVVESVFSATLDMAVVTHRTSVWIVPGVGPVIERWESTVKVLGVPVPRDRGTAVRIAPLPAPDRLPAPTLSSVTKPRVLIAVPAFNEERTVDRVLGRIAAFELPTLVVDDGSKDGTAAKVAAYPVELVRHARNEGYGAVMRAIFGWAAQRDFDWVITMDCDDQHEPSFIPKFLDEIARADVDVVSGSRYLSSMPSDVSAPADREAINRTITAEINDALRGAFERPLTDSFCGFKAYRAHACHALQLTAAGYEFPMQFWVQAAANRLRVREIPVARIYLDTKRSFGSGLDDPTRRLAVYRSTLVAELERCAARLRHLRPTVTVCAARCA